MGTSGPEGRGGMRQVIFIPMIHEEDDRSEAVNNLIAVGPEKLREEIERDSKNLWGEISIARIGLVSDPSKKKYFLKRSRKLLFGL